MDERLLKQTAIISFSLMVLIVVMSLVMSRTGQGLMYTGSSNEEANIPKWYGAGKNAGTLKDNGNLETLTSIKDELGEKYLIIKKSNSLILDASLKDLYMERSIRLTVKGLKTKEFDNNSILRVNQDEEFLGPAGEDEVIKRNQEELERDTNEKEEESANQEEEQLLIPEVISASGEVSDYGNIPASIMSDPVNDFQIEYTKEEQNGTYTAVIEIELDYIYAPILYQDEENIYIALKRPKDVYDKIVVIDAGHGGKDVGASSADKKYYEKDINLQIVLYLKELLDQEDIKVYYTRTTDETIYLNPRVYFANDVEADLFLSIHCNSNDSPIPNGIEVLYNELQDGKDFSSKDLAALALEELEDATGRNNRGLVTGSKMVVVGKAKVPVALIEVSFMSNEEDMEFLAEVQNQKNIAKAVYKTVMKGLSQIKE